MNITHKELKSITTKLNVFKNANNLLMITKSGIKVGDDENQITIKLDTEVSKSYYLKYDVFLKVVKYIKTTNVELKEIDNEIYLNNFILPEIKIEEGESYDLNYLYMNNILKEEKTKIKIENSNLNQKLKLLSTSIDSRNPKFELNCVLLDTKYQKLVSSDTRRLTVIDLKDSIVTDKEQKLIIPKIIVKFLLQSKETKLNISVENLDAKISFEDYDLNFKLINGKFPDYQRIIPQTTKLDFKLDFDIPYEDNTHLIIKNEYIDVVNLNNDVKMRIKQTEQNRKPELEIAFNNKYILDVTKTQTKDVEFCFNYENLPFVLKCEHEDKVISMPIKIEDYI